MQVTAYSDIGKHRKINQDSYYVCPDNNYFIIADGMGGHKGGEIASRSAVVFMQEYIEKNKPQSLEQVSHMLEAGVDKVNRIVHEISRESHELEGMGTTFICAYVFEKTITIAHVGDSRLYHISSEAEIRRVTKDHSVVEAMIDMGTITAEEAQVHPQRNMITRAVGSDITIETDIYTVELNEGEWVVMCTDGLTNMVDEKEILKTVMHSGGAKELVDLANDQGGMDNITVIVIQA